LKYRYQDLSEALPLHPPRFSGPDVDRFREDGVLLLPNFISPDRIDAYCRLREKVPLGGWPATPYLHYRELRDIALDARLMDQMKRLVGEEVGLHLNLTGWVSTERSWHSDSYLNPEGVDDHYIAAWIALEDIQPDCGPFQYIRGSHRWPVLRRAKLFAHLSPAERDDPQWPAFTQDDVSAACEEERLRLGAEVMTHLPRKGDVLLWHAFLVHRGSLPTRPGALRRTLIAHYSGVPHRRDMIFIRDRQTRSSMALWGHRVPAGMPSPTIGLLDALPVRAAQAAQLVRDLVKGKPAAAATMAK
jgi:hypothetical protein